MIFTRSVPLDVFKDLSLVMYYSILSKRFTALPESNESTIFFKNPKKGDALITGIILLSHSRMSLHVAAATLQRNC